jgi:hypothetical protein
VTGVKPPDGKFFRERGALPLLRILYYQKEETSGKMKNELNANALTPARHLDTN